MSWLALTTSNFFIDDYKGEDNYLILYLLISFFILLFAGTIGVYLYSRYKELEFIRICKQAELTDQELRHFEKFLKRMHMHHQKIKIITDIRHFNVFIARLAHYHESSFISEADLLAESDLFNSIRKKLDFKHHFNEHPLINTRSMALKYPLNISFDDPKTGTTISFHARVRYNNEFFLGINPPDPEIAQQVYNQLKPELKVSFIRNEDAEYLFDSFLVRKVTHPETMWYIRHTGRLVRLPMAKNLEIPATIMLSQEDSKGGYSEFEATIQTLDKKSATFILRDPTTTLQPNTSILLNFENEGKPVAWGGVVTDPVCHPDDMIYRTKFDIVSDKDNLIMLKLMKKAGTYQSHEESIITEDEGQ